MKWCRFERHCASSSFSGRVYAGKKDEFSPTNASLSPSHLSKPWQNPYPFMTYYHNEKKRRAMPCEWLHRGHPSHLTLSPWLNRDKEAHTPPASWLDRGRVALPPPAPINTPLPGDEGGWKKIEEIGGDKKKKGENEKQRTTRKREN